MASARPHHKSNASSKLVLNIEPAMEMGFSQQRSEAQLQQPQPSVPPPSQKMPGHLNFAFLQKKEDPVLKPSHFSQRKNSMFVQGENIRGNQRYAAADRNGSNMGDDFDSASHMIHKKTSGALSHRRATTHFVGNQEKSLVFYDGMFEERQEIIKGLRDWTEKMNSVPPTEPSYYKLTKCVGKGAFGKVMLGVHKLTGC